MNGEEDVKTGEDTPEVTAEEQQAEETAPASEPQFDEETEGRNAIEKALDDMGIAPDDDGEKHEAPEAEKPAEGGEGQQAAPAEKPAAEPQEKPAEAAPQPPKAPATPEQEEADLVKGVASERGRQRLTQLLREGREARTGLETVRQMVTNSGLDQESFGNLMTITKLCSSSNPNELERGLQLLEEVRASLYRQVGREAPGVDLLAGQKDLQDRVNAMQLNREDALAIARGREAQEAQKAKMQAEMQAQQETAAFQQKLEGFKTSTMSALSARQNDLDFQQRIERLVKHFTPQEIQRFVTEVPPEAWSSTIMYYYDLMGNVAPQAVVPRANPIVGRPARAAGTRLGVNKKDTPDGIASVIDEMGL